MNAHAGAGVGAETEAAAEAKAGPNAEPASESGRARYHHGDLANALTREGFALARAGGPDAVVLREAARRVGVSPAAAYRHFAGHDDLRYAVKVRAQQELADAMDAAIQTVEPMAEPGPEALRRLGAIGAAYVHFALDEPGLFRTAFCHASPPQQEAGAPSRAPGDWHGPVVEELVEGGAGEGELARQGAAGEGAAAVKEPAAVAERAEEAREAAVTDETSAQVNNMLRYRPFQMLSEGLDRLVALGILSPERRPNAEIPAWSMVHGLATLLLDGPLELENEAARDAVLDLALRTIIDGLLN